MVIVTNNYQDFLTVTSQFNPNKATVFFVEALTVFKAYFIAQDDEISVEIAVGGTGLPPSPFNADFPHAIQLSQDITING